MSKKQPEPNFAETFVSLVELAAKHPEATKAAFRTIDALGAVTYELTSAALNYLFPPKQEAATQEPEVLSSYVDEQQEAFADEGQEAFTAAPFWPLTEDHPVGFVNGFFPVYESPYSRMYRRPGMFRL